MTQRPPSDFPFDPTVTTGTQLTEYLTHLVASIESCYAGANRPSYLTQGGLWVDDTDRVATTPSVKLMMFTGSTDVEIAQIFTVTGTITISGIPANIIDEAMRNVANGFAGLDASAKIDLAQLPDTVLGAMIYQGSWDASTNTPTMPAAAVANKGHYYIVNVAGTTDIDGEFVWNLGDWIVSDGTRWDKIDNAQSVASVNGHVGIVVLNKIDIGLSNVDNTADLDKPMSTATGVAVALKADATDITNVDNTSDADKPVSTATQTALDLKLDADTKGAALGVAELDSNSKVPLNQLPDAVVHGLHYMGTWNALTNVPPIPASAAANEGQYYVVEVAGTTDIDGNNVWAIGDWIVSDGTQWDKIDNSAGGVVSVNGQTGIVTLDKANVGLANADNTSDLTKHTDTALTGNPTAPTRPADDATTSLATTEFVDRDFVTKSGDTVTGQIKGIAPVDDEDLTRKDYVDDGFVDVTGDTMTGALTLRTPTAGDPFADDEAISKSFVDDNFVNKDGTSEMVVTYEPSMPQHVSTKEYVDINRPNHNYLMNPYHRIMERGTKQRPIVGEYFGADRWMLQAAGGPPVTKKGPVSGGSQGYRMDILGKDGNTYAWMGQRIESRDTVQMMYEDITFTVNIWALTDQDILLHIDVPSAVDDWSGTNTIIASKTVHVTGDPNAVTKIVLTCPKANNLLTGRGVAVQIDFLNGLVDGDHIGFFGLKLELGDKSTPIEDPDFGAELLKCQRYYYHIDAPIGSYVQPLSGAIRETLGADVMMPLPAVMRVVQPKLLLVGDWAVRRVAGGGAKPFTYPHVPPSIEGTMKGCTYHVDFVIPDATGLAAGDACRIMKTDTVNGFIALDAEL